VTAACGAASTAGSTSVNATRKAAVAGVPPSLLAEHALKMKDGQMFHVLTFGQNNMPSYASQLSREDRWSVIGFVRSLQAQVPATPSATTKVAAEAGVSPAAAAGGQQ
jgi:mono/diheme cytochrome c family protein